MEHSWLIRFKRWINAIEYYWNMNFEQHFIVILRLGCDNQWDWDTFIYQSSNDYINSEWYFSLSCVSGFNKVDTDNQISWICENLWSTFLLQFFVATGNLPKLHSWEKAISIWTCRILSFHSVQSTCVISSTQRFCFEFVSVLSSFNSSSSDFSVVPISIGSFRCHIQTL